MTKIENEMQYQVALKRVEELMLSLPEDTPEYAPEMVELILLGHPSRISEYLSGKKEPTLPQARVISQKLNIDPAIVLGV